MIINKIDRYRAGHIKLFFLALLLVTSIATTTLFHLTQRDEIYYLKANKLFKGGKYNQAIPLYKKSLKYNPTLYSSLRELAYSYSSTGQNTKAQKTLKSLLILKGDTHKDSLYNNISIKKELADSYISTKEHKKAVDLYRDIIHVIEERDIAAKELGLQRIYIDSLTNLAKILSWMGDYKNAIDIYKNILTIEPDNIEIRKDIANTYFWNKDYKEAQSILNDILKDNPSDKESELLLAQIEDYSGETDKALKKYEELAKDKNLKDMESKIEDLLSKAYMATEDYEKAIIEYRKKLKRDPNDISVMKDLARIYSWNKEYAKAERMYRDILKKTPDNNEIILLLAELLTWQSRFKDSIELLDSARVDHKDPQYLMIYAKSLLYSGDCSKAKEILDKLISIKPLREAKTLLADSYAYSKEYDKAISLYKELLLNDYSKEVEIKLADTLSWAKKYRESIALYDKLLNIEDEKSLRLQKARVLGWMRDYYSSLREYEKAFEEYKDKNIYLEMKSKEAYWNNRTKRAIRLYKSLIERDPTNTEAIFDLAEIYSYEKMFKEAENNYKEIITIYPTHFRAQEGLKKIAIKSKKVSLETLYNFYEADSEDRGSDVRVNKILNRLNIPLNLNTSIILDNNLVHREFFDLNSIDENEFRIAFNYRANPNYWLNLNYGIIDYNSDLSAFHDYGFNFGLRTFDIGKLDLKYQKERLENNSSVIFKRIYKKDYKAIWNIDINRYLKLNLGYSYLDYSDGNNSKRPEFGILYYLSLEPTMFLVKYRYYHDIFDFKSDDYFSPSSFWTQNLTFNYRKFLNKDEIFFGADNIYYDIAYTISVDSKDVLGHKFSLEYNWDINKRLNFNIKAALYDSSSNTYKESRLSTGFKYYF